MEVARAFDLNEEVEETHLPLRRSGRDSSIFPNLLKIKRTVEFWRFYKLAGFSSYNIKHNFIPLYERLLSYKGDRS